MTWMLYGANGYTGRLIAEEAVRRGMAPILAGRSQAVADLAGQLGLEARIFPVSDAARHLGGVSAVLLCAGPFSATSAPMLAACLAVGTHYLDIAGEIAVFEAIYARDAELRAAGVAAVPGVGFDVVPTECLAARLKADLPDATDLALGVAGVSAISSGTARTVLEGVGEGLPVRRSGKLVTVSAGSVSRPVPFRDRAVWAMGVPLADISAAYRSTGIPHIDVFVPMPWPLIFATRLAAPFMPLLGLLRRPIAALLPRVLHGPSAEQREKARVVVWGEAIAPGGKRVTRRFEVPEPYRFTVAASLAAVARVLEGVEPGASTPSQAFGAAFLDTLPGIVPLT